MTDNINDILTEIQRLKSLLFKFMNQAGIDSFTVPRNCSVSVQMSRTVRKQK
ncbi:MAG: hypothetical protein GX640_02580 [Fibrobacter sp.]|nr:hypothetical protein [Fibrobacter sp.]